MKNISSGRPRKSVNGSREATKTKCAAAAKPSRCRAIIYQKKEREALNGECKTYKKKDFYTWQEFKELPNDLQVAWVNSCINRFGAGVETISEIVFGCSKKNLRNHLTRIGEMQYINKPLTGKAGKIAKKKLAEAFALWKNAQITMCEELPAEPETVATKPEEIVEEPSAPDILRYVEKTPLVKLPSFDASNIAALIAALAGSGAKLTIEVVL